MMRHIPLIALRVVLMCVALCSSARAQRVEWLRQTTGFGGYAISFTLATDAAGMSYVGGQFNDSTAFGSYHFGRTFLRPLIVACVDPDGIVRWAAASSGGEAQVTSITPAEDNDLLVTGWFAGTMTFGRRSYGDAGLSSFDLSGFVARMSSDGAVKWLTYIGGDGNSHAWDAASTGDGGCFLAGSFQGTGRFDSTRITSRGRSDAYIARLDRNGRFEWIQTFGGGGFDQTNSVVAASDGGCWAAAVVVDTAVIGNDTIRVKRDAEQMLVTRYDRGGALQWMRASVGDNQRLIAFRMRRAPSGHLSITGHFQGTIDFSGEQLHSDGLTDGFAMSIDTSASVRWIKRIGGPADDFVRGLTIDAHDHTYVAGMFGVDARSDTFTLSRFGGLDAAVIELDENGNTIRAHVAGGTGTDRSDDVGMLPDGDLVACYSVDSPAAFDHLSVASPRDELAVARIDWPHAGADASDDPRTHRSSSISVRVTDGCIQLTLASAATLRVHVTDVLGQTLVQQSAQYIPAGTHALPLDAQPGSTGTIFVHLISDSSTRTVRCTLLK